ncbi:MAG: ATP synthase F1 subunit delta [Acidobacteria bacterium]|nr:ATP synthase F1 subunit delta [Acidobacteriota bacterium]
MSMVIASRYARALADVLRSAEGYRAGLKELEDFAAVWQESESLREVLLTPAVSSEQKRKVLDAVLERLGTSVPTSNLLRILLANYRMALLEQVLEAFKKVVDERLGIVEVEILYAQDLSPDEQEELRAKFAELTGSKVEVKFRQDAKLLGGVQARIGSTVYDGSVLGYLERLREQLRATS